MVPAAAMMRASLRQGINPAITGVAVGDGLVERVEAMLTRVDIPTLFIHGSLERNC
jgi:hypothetical protein